MTISEALQFYWLMTISEALQFYWLMTVSGALQFYWLMTISEALQFYWFVMTISEARVHLTGVFMGKTGSLAKGNHSVRLADRQKTGELGKAGEGGRKGSAGAHSCSPHAAPVIDGEQPAFILFVIGL